MNILVPDLHEDTAALGEQVAGHHQAVAQVAEVGVDAQSQVSRKALICSGWRVTSSALPSLTSRLRVETCQLEPNLMP